jgi:hypothetical protein
MPHPRWGWFAVAVLATVTGVWMVSAGYFSQTGSGPPGGPLFALVALVAVWSFGRAFFNFRFPPRDKG